MATERPHEVSQSVAMLIQSVECIAMSAAAVKRLEALFRDVKIEPERRVSVVTVSVDKKCDVHGGFTRRTSVKKDLDPRRVSMPALNVGHAKRRESISFRTEPPNHRRRDSMPALNLIPPAASLRRRDSIVLASPVKNLTHPSAFPSTLRSDSRAASVGSLRRDPVRRDSRPPTLRKDSLASSFGSLRRDSISSSRRDSISSIASSRRDSIGRRRFSTDSLDSVRRNSWDPGRRGSTGSSGGWDDPILEESEQVSLDRLKMCNSSIFC